MFLKYCIDPSFDSKKTLDAYITKMMDANMKHNRVIFIDDNKVSFNETTTKSSPSKLELASNSKT